MQSGDRRLRLLGRGRALDKHNQLSRQTILFGEVFGAEHVTAIELHLVRNLEDLLGDLQEALVLGEDEAGEMGEHGEPTPNLRGRTAAGKNRNGA